MHVFKIISFAVVWGLFVLCATFLQLITKGEFVGFIGSEFNFGTIGVSILAMSIVFLLDTYITHQVSPFGKYLGIVFEVIILSTIGVLSIILISQLNKVLNLYVLSSIVLFFITAKFCLLLLCTSITRIKDTETKLKDTEMELKLI